MEDLEDFVGTKLAPVCLRTCLKLQEVHKKHKDTLPPELSEAIFDLVEFLCAMQDVYLPCVSISRNRSEEYLKASTIVTR